MWTGILEWVDVGTGAWVLRTANETFTLLGKISKELAGSTVKVEGVSAEDQFSTAMTGPCIVVSSLTRED